MLSPGDDVDARFEPLRELGRGGMGVVYQARERASGREVALKLLPAGALDVELAARFRREAEAGAALRHPGIVAVHAAGLAGSRPWIAFELVTGARPLDRAWRDLDRAARVALVRDAARALGHAHARGVVHRDVKVENLLVGDDGRVRVADLGLAQLAGHGRLTATGAVLGTPYAMAPEQAMGDREAIGPAADVWGLGVVLYEALTGRRPFEGASTIEVLGKVCDGRFVAPRAVDPGIPPALEAVCLRALARAPADRHADGEALAEALDAALSGAVGQRRAPALALALGGLGALALGLAWVTRLDAPPVEPLPPGAADVAPRPSAAEPLAAVRAGGAAPAQLEVTPEEAGGEPRGAMWALGWILRRVDREDGVTIGLVRLCLARLAAVEPEAARLLERAPPGVEPDLLTRGHPARVLSSRLHQLRVDDELRNAGELRERDRRAWRRLCAELGCARCITWVGEEVAEAGDPARGEAWLRRAPSDRTARARLGHLLLALPGREPEGRALLLAGLDHAPSELNACGAARALAEGIGGPVDRPRAAAALREAVARHRHDGGAAAAAQLLLLLGPDVPEAPGERADLQSVIDSAPPRPAVSPR